MSKVQNQVENISYAQPESICFFPISSWFVKKKKHFWTVWDSKKVLSFHFFKTIGQILFLDTAWI